MTQEELKEMFGEELTEKINKIKALFLHFLQVLPEAPYSHWYEFSDSVVGHIIENNERARHNREDLAMKTAISIILFNEHNHHSKREEEGK